MDRMLRVLGKTQPEVSIDEEKLKYFVSKVPKSIYFSITEQDFKSSSADEKTRMPSKYYCELYQKYYGLGKCFYSFVIMFDSLLSAILCLVLTVILFLIVLFE